MDTLNISGAHPLERIGLTNRYINIYLTNFIGKFREFNSDRFTVVISGLKQFIDSKDLAFEHLVASLQDHDITILYDGDQESVESLQVRVENTTLDSTHSFDYRIHCLAELIELSSKSGISVVGIITMKVIGQVVSKIKCLYKAIVLDLDDTLWKGTLSENGFENICEKLSSPEGEPFRSFMRFIKVLSTELGIFVGICSRNEIAMVEKVLEKLSPEMFPLKGQIDCITANFNDKSKNIKQIADELHILPGSIVFVDDNEIIRDEVNKTLPQVFVPEWSNHQDLATQLILCCVFDRSELSLHSQRRRSQSKIIESERMQNTLPHLKVNICQDIDHTNAIKLYSKSNQFKFSRNDSHFPENSISLCFDLLREDGTNLGICSALTYAQKDKKLIVSNWAISCRFFEIGLEEFILSFLQKQADNKFILLDYTQTAYNAQVKKLIDKYPQAFTTQSDHIYKVEFTDYVTELMSQNTKLTAI